jgi:hypothetical protein
MVVLSCTGKLCLLSGYCGKVLAGCVASACRGPDLICSYLVWTHHVVEPDHDCRKSVALHIALHHHLCGRLARRVRIGWLQDVVLGHVGRESFAVHLGNAQHLSVRVVCSFTDPTNLISGNVVIPLDLGILLDALQQDVRADDIVHGEFVRVAKAQVDVGVGGEVEDGVDVVFLQTFDHVGGDGHISVEEVEVSQLLRLQQARIVERAAIVEFVKGYNVVVSLVFDG